jgi:hypothetical protein
MRLSYVVAGAAFVAPPLALGAAAVAVLADRRSA